MADETPETLRAQIDHQRRLAQLVTDAGVRAEIEKMIEELERRLRELENGEPKQNMRITRQTSEFDHEIYD